jgi:hypothetical protein
MAPFSPRAYARPIAIAVAGFLATSGCTGLAAGPQSSAQTPVPVPRDSAWARARRALSSEAFTLDVVDSTGGRLIGTRYASANAKLGTQPACRMTLALGIRGDAQQSELSSTSRWIASEKMADKAPEVCERERTEVLERIATTVAPPPAQ